MRKVQGMRGKPAGVVGGESAGGNHAMDMGMDLQLPTPIMKHAEEADLPRPT